MKINRFNQFVSKRLFEDVEPIQTPDNLEKEEGMERTEDTELDDDSNLIDDIDTDDFDSEESDFGDDFDSEESDFEEMPVRKRTVNSFDDFDGPSEDDDLSDMEMIGGEFSENEPDEQDYMPKFNGEEEEMGGEEEEESGEYKGDLEMKKLADLLGVEVVNNQIEYDGKKINYFSETEMFHIGKKKFEDAESVIEYLEGGMGSMEKQPENVPMGMDIPEEDERREMAMESRRFLRRR
jgi:hypothetical protein